MTLLAVVALAAVALGQTKKEFEAFLSVMEPKAAKAFANKDVKFFEGIAAKEFTYQDHMGKTENLKDSMAGMGQMFGMADKVKMFYKRGAVTLKGSTGTVEYNSTYHITLKPGPDKKVHVMTVKGKTRETWKKMGATWKVVNITDTAAPEMLMDGKPVGGGG